MTTAMIMAMLPAIAAAHAAFFALLAIRRLSRLEASIRASRSEFSSAALTEVDPNARCDADALSESETHSSFVQQRSCHDF